MLLEWWSGTECVIHTDPQAYPKYGKENAIVVLNHKFEIDFLCGWSLAERFGVLGNQDEHLLMGTTSSGRKQGGHRLPLCVHHLGQAGSGTTQRDLRRPSGRTPRPFHGRPGPPLFQGSKVLAKKELAYVPIIGWMWYFTEMVFCTRKWEQDRKTVSESLLHLRDYPEKYFFLIHCEGTRFTEKKHQISMQVAQAKGLPSLKHHLLPRTKGFAITVRSLRNVGGERAELGDLPASPAPALRPPRPSILRGEPAGAQRGLRAPGPRSSLPREAEAPSSSPACTGDWGRWTWVWTVWRFRCRPHALGRRLHQELYSSPCLSFAYRPKGQRLPSSAGCPTPANSDDDDGDDDDGDDSRAILTRQAAQAPHTERGRSTRIPLGEVPEDEDRCAAWLHKLYQEKEVPAQRAARPHRGEGRGAGEGVGGPGAGGQAALCPQDALQEEYSRTGTFPGTPVVPPRRPWTLINWLFWASLLLYPFFRFLVNMVSSGSSLTLASFVLVFFVGESGASGAWAGGAHLREGQGGGGHRAACEDKARLQIPQVDRQKLEPGPETPAWRASARAPPPPSVGVRWMIGVTEIDKGSAYGNMDSKLKHSG
ncbi:hypothetical protein J1605_017378 [Eschrichtius robustus]|uniref:1-acyl-sn-glycerol-3-phosphate acyltransferase delta n=1 Tax=Eschrichtius robustus TaxID=9764 RepID=A0AB34I2F9_ESCRO|nr:hypothetical protein J1605_017378 [Eschrichtius robustus]